MRVRPKQASNIALALSIVSISCSAPSQESHIAREHAAVMAVTIKIINADNAGDIDTVMSLYEDDAVLLPPEEEPILGKEFIRPRYQSLFDHSQLEVFSTSEETIISGDWAFERGTTSGKIIPKGKGKDLARIVDDQYLLILHKQPTGSWKIARLMWHAKHRT